MKKIGSILTLFFFSYLTYSQSNLIKNVTITVDTTLLKTKTVQMGMITNLYHKTGQPHSNYYSITPNDWHYVVITKDNSLNSNIYIDGVLKGTEIYGDWAFNWYKLYLGTSFVYTFNDFYKGWIDDFRISNKVRTSSEILANYNSNLPLTKDANTVALWKFDETTGKSFSNQVQGLSNGTLYGNAQFQLGKFGNSAYFDGVNSYGDCNYDMPETNVTLEFWVKLDGFKNSSTAIQPYGMYSGNITFSTDTILTNTSKNITWSTGDTGYSITVNPKTTPTVWVSNGVNKDTINFNNKCSNQSTLPNYISTNGLVAYYPFSGNANDISGNNNNGTVNGATLTTDRFGNPNSAYSFDGVSNKISTNLNTINSKKITISTWYKNKQTITNNLDHPTLIGSRLGSNLFTGIGFNQNSLFFDLIDNNTNVVGRNSVLINIPIDNKWHNLISVYDGDTSKLYSDGVLLNTLLIKTNSETIQNNVIIGNDPISSGNRFWKGEIDDIRIYNRALSINEISALYNENQCLNKISVTDTLKISHITGLNTLPSNFGLVKVYPNPAKDVLNISVSNPSTSYSIQITNQLGQVLYTNTLSNSSLQVNVNSLGAIGLYFIKILDLSNNNVLDTRKLIFE